MGTGTMTAISKTLTVATFDVFEKMFYLFLEPAAVENRQYDLVASLSFSGAHGGAIRLHLPNSVALAMAENMMSLPQADITRPLMEDCAREAVNMIGGQFIRTLDPAEAFHVSVPVCSVNEPVAQQAGLVSRYEGWLNFESDKGVFAVSYEEGRRV
jgi:hypothetical protein